MIGEVTEKAERKSGENRSADLCLAASCARGDKAAQREVLSRLFDRVRRTTTYLAGPSGEAEDLAQVALVKILAAIESYRGECMLESWADKITLWTVKKHFHKMKRRASRAEAVWDPGKPPEALDERIASRELRRGLAVKLQELSYERRVVVVLHHVEGYGVAEVAQMTDTNVNTVRDRLRKGRSLLRKKVLADPALRTWAEALEP